MSISGPSPSSIQQANFSAITTSEKTVHNSDIKNLKQQCKSINNTTKNINTQCTSSILVTNSIFKPLNDKIAKVKKANGKVQVLLNEVNSFKKQLATSSYKHNPSKMKALNTLENQLNGLQASLKQSSSNIKAQKGVDAHNYKVTAPKLLEAEAARKAKTETSNRAFEEQNPGYTHGGMRAGYR